MLFLIWAIPVFFMVFLYGMKKRRKILSLFASPRALKAIAPSFTSDLGFGPRWIKAGLILCVLLFIALALSGPQYGYYWQEIERRGIDIIIALDCSRSMLASDISPTRLDRAKREVYDLLTMLEGDRAGLVAFAGTAFLQCPLTLDYDAFNLFLKTLSPDFLPVGGTDITGAVNAAISGFDEKTDSEKALILITDGENTGNGDPIKAAEDARKAGIKVFSIGVGSEEGVPVPEKKGGFKKDKSGKIILTKLDEDTLKKMAVLTGGTYVRSVAGDMDLDAIYTEEIRGRMERTTLESGRKQIWEDRYQWFLALAIIALAAELFLSSAKQTGMLLVLCLLLAFPALSQAGPAQEGFEAYEKGDYEKALKLFIDAQLEDPENPKILYNIGDAYYKVGDFDSAIKNFGEVLKNENRELRQKAFYNLGNSHYKKEMFEEAIKNYEEALNIKPDDEQAKQNIEFVKKVMEQKKKEEQQKQQEKGEDKKEGDSEDEKKSGEQKSPSEENQQGDPEKKDSDENSTPNYGDEMKENQKAASAQEESPDKKAEDKENASAAQASSAEDSENMDDKKQAERMLNRLEDRPGRAMIPGYRERHVEKDW